MRTVQEGLSPQERREIETFAAERFGAFPLARVDVVEADEMFRVARRQSASAVEALKRYLSVGFNVHQALDATLREEGVDPRSIRRYLDFAGGYGRNARFAPVFLPEAEIWLCEIDRDAVDFASRKLGARGVYSTLYARDFALEEQFDLILVVSLFTHLQPPVFDDWLARLVGLLAPEGRLIATTHPIDAPRGAFAWREIAPGEFYFTEYSEAEGRLDLDYYGAALVSRDYVRAVVERAGGMVTRVLPQRISTHDVHVIRRAT